MPPNNPLSYENLLALDLSKLKHNSGFLPLTHPDEEQQHQESVAAAAAVSTTPVKSLDQVVVVEPKKSSSPVGLIVEDLEEEHEEVEEVKVPASPVQVTKYNETIERILAQDRARNILSCDAMVQNLVADSVSRRTTKDIQEESSEVVETSENYWGMPATSQVQAHVDVNISTSIQPDDDQEVISAAHVHDSTHPNHSYWDWDGSPSTTTQIQAQLLQSILHSEAIRQLLSVNHVSSIEEMNAKVNDVSLLRKDIVQHEHYSANHSDTYWEWSNDVDDETKEEVVASHVNDASHPHHSYWDWESTPTSTKDVQQQLIIKILKQDKLRQMISSDFMVQTEAAAAAVSSSTPTTSICATHRSSSMDTNDYWTHTSDISEDTKMGLEKEDTILQIMESEERRELVSTACVVDQLVKDASIRHQQQEQSIVVNGDVGSSASSYWDW